MPTYFSSSFSEMAAKLSDEAFRAHIDALCWSGKDALDQRIPKSRAPRRWGADNDPGSPVYELVSGGWWLDLGDSWDVSLRAEGLWRQETRAERQRRRADDADRQSRRRKGVNEAVLDRDGRQCLRCGTELDLTVDHKLARFNGGTSELTNLQTLCRACNSRKGTKVEPG